MTDELRTSLDAIGQTYITEDVLGRRETSWTFGTSGFATYTEHPDGTVLFVMQEEATAPERAMLVTMGSEL